MGDTDIKLDARMEKLTALPERIQHAFAVARERAHVWAIDAHGEFIETHLSGNPIRRWTGQLERSFQVQWGESPASFRAGVAFSPTMTGPGGTFRNYAYILEGVDDQTIRPKNGRMLAWPFPGGPAATAGGIPRYAGPRQYPGKIFVHRNSKGHLYLAEQSGQSLRYVYILANSVTIRKRMGFRAWAVPKRQQGDEAIKVAFREALA